MGTNERVTDSGITINQVYGPDDLADWDPATRLGSPGAYPYELDYASCCTNSTLGPICLNGASCG